MDRNCDSMTTIQRNELILAPDKWANEWAAVLPGGPCAAPPAGFLAHAVRVRTRPLGSVAPSYGSSSVSSAVIVYK